MKSWKTKSPLHTHHCNLSLPPFTCDCCNYVNSSLILVIVSGILPALVIKFFFPSSHTRYLQYFSLDIVHYRHHLDTDALHHVQLPSAVQVQNGLKLAGGPGHDHDDDWDLGRGVNNNNDKLDPVGSTVRYEMMKLCTGSV